MSNQEFYELWDELTPEERELVREYAQYIIWRRDYIEEVAG